MADEQTPAPEGGEEKKGGLPLKTIIIVALAMVLEGGAIAAVFMLAGGPSKVEATEVVDEELAGLDEPAEVPVITAKFQNTRRGIPYTYDVEVSITVKQKYVEELTERVLGMEGRLQSDIGRIYRQAEPAHLAETELLTIKRQIGDAINQRLGVDENDEPYVLEVLIPRSSSYRSDL